MPEAKAARAGAGPVRERLAAEASPSLRFGLVSLAGLMLVLCGAEAAHAQRRDQEQPMPKDQLAAELRKAIGLDAKVMAILDIKKEDYQAAVEQSIVQSQERRAELEPAAKEMARLDKIRGVPYERKDAATYRAAHKAHAQSIVPRVSAWVVELERKMSPEAQRAFARVRVNEGLDAELRLLELTDEQRELLWRATIERDDTLQNPAHMHSSAKCEYAMQKYEETVATILSAEQKETLTAYRQKVQERWFDMLQAEVAAFEETKDQGN